MRVPTWCRIHGDLETRGCELAEELRKFASAPLAAMECARVKALEDVVEAARTLRIDGKGVSIAQANERMDDALAALDALPARDDSDAK